MPNGGGAVQRLMPRALHRPELQEAVFLNHSPVRDLIAAMSTLGARFAHENDVHAEARPKNGQLALDC